MAVRMVTFGDSVTWGQGLLDPQKLHTIIATHLGFAPAETLLVAHSGAIIGADAADRPDPRLHGEVPHPFPTILQQITRYNTPDTVVLIIINGGINDVGVTTILNPLTSVAKLQHLTDNACRVDLQTLLRAVLQRFTHPE